MFQLKSYYANTDPIQIVENEFENIESLQSNQHDEMKKTQE